MEAAQLATELEATEAPPGLTSQRRARDDDRDTETRETRHKRRGTTTCAALSDRSNVEDEESGRAFTEHPASEDESYATHLETALSVSSWLDIFDRAPVRIA